MSRKTICRGMAAVNGLVMVIMFCVLWNRPFRYEAELQAAPAPKSTQMVGTIEQTYHTTVSVGDTPADRIMYWLIYVDKDVENRTLKHPNNTKVRMTGRVVGHCNSRIYFLAESVVVERD